MLFSGYAERGAVEIISGFLYWQPGMPEGNDLQIPESLIPAGTDTVTGDAIRSATQFLVGYAVGGKALRGVRAATGTARFAKASLQGGISDALFFEAMDGRLADLISDVPELARPVHSFLKSGPDESELEARFKRALEGFGLGVVTEGLLIALRGMRSAVRARHGGTADVGPDVPDIPDMPKTAEAVENAETKFPRLEDYSIEGLTTVPKGRYILRDSTKKGARYRNIDIEDMGLEEFRGHFLENGFVFEKSYPKGIRYEKPDGSRYFLRENSTSRELPTADYISPGKKKTAIKYRLLGGK